MIIEDEGDDESFGGKTDRIIEERELGHAFYQKAWAISSTYSPSQWARAWIQMEGVDGALAKELAQAM